jgi:DUF2075 family protein
MPAYYRSMLREFVRHTEAEDIERILGKLAEQNAAARFPLSPEALDAWKLQLSPLVEGCSKLIATVPATGDYQILLEYPIPRIGKRIDAVLLLHDLVVAIETKTGYAPTSAQRQVDDYCIYLACFHEPSANRRIVPLVVSDGKVSRSGERPYAANFIQPCEFASTKSVGEVLIGITQHQIRADAEPIDAAAWDRGVFRPIPPIIDAAVSLYSEMEVFEIGHACAPREDLTRATEALIKVVLECQSSDRKAICFVTGVPGAGKTLVGLNAVHHKHIRQYGAFLSGNGPLIKIIREALIRDVVRRGKRTGRGSVTRRAAEIAVQAFVQSVHRFADDHYVKSSPVPSNRIIIFDEAQRAWDSEQNERAKRPAVSEAHMMLDVMNRHAGWAVLVCLIGGGQEINRGEAGLVEWGNALRDFPDWRVCASPLVLDGKSGEAFRLFRELDEIQNNIRNIPDFHLEVSTRSIRAQRISDWVDRCLAGDCDRASQLAASMSSRPLLTRSLSDLRCWLRSMRIGSTRAGLLASAGASRLRTDGIETSFDFHQRFEWERWFLDRDECEDVDCNHKYCHDVRASSKLEVAATQFEVQGLELDWVGLCWGEDLLWTGQAWESFNFNGKVWNPNTNRMKHRYRINGYRVLLTRARQGMAIYVPKPALQDRSRKHESLNSTADFLLAAGAWPLEARSPGKHSEQ